MEAALELFSERGFHGTAVPLIAERAGVGAGTVYRYFESKEAIVNSLYQQYKQILAEKMLAAVTPDMAPREQFHSYWATLTKFARENTEAYSFLELHHHSPYLDDASRAIEAQLFELARQRFEEFRQARIVKDIAPEVLMSLVHGAFVGLVKASRQHPMVMSPESMTAAEQCVWEAIRG
jgi:AcrR family transcriptional regulator